MARIEDMKNTENWCSYHEWPRATCLCNENQEVAMKAFNASALSNNRAEVMKAAREGGVIIQEKRTNGEVMCEYVLQKAHKVIGDVIAFNEPTTEGE